MTSPGFLSTYAVVAPKSLMIQVCFAVTDVYHTGYCLGFFLRHMLNHGHILYILLEYGHIVSLMLGLLSKHLIYSLHEFCLGRIIYPKIRENKNTQRP